MEDKTANTTTDIAKKKNKHSKSLSAKKPFKPTPHMKVYLNTAVQMVGAPVKHICDEAQISEAIYYEWKKDPRFWDWYVDEYAKKRRRLIPELDSIGMKYAKRGNYNFWEAMNKKAGEDLSKEKGTNVNIVGQDMAVEFISGDTS